MFFQYGEKEITYLKSKDKKLGRVIDQVGHINRLVDTDLFSSVVHHILGQQISAKAHQTICNRMLADLGEVSAKSLLAAGPDRLQSYGTTYKKVDSILDFARKVNSGEFDLASLPSKTDAEAIAELSALKGIGVWTAEMLLLHCLERPDIFSFGDLAILRGIRMVYHYKEIDKKRFEMYRKRFSPYCSVASLYFWAVSGGAIPELKDFAPKERKARNK